MTAAGPGSAERTTWQSALAAHLAFRGAVGDVSGTTRRLSGELSRLEASTSGIAGRASGLFVRYVDHGVQQLRWMEAELAAATRLANAASEVKDSDMQLALLRLAGPRLESAMMGSLLLSVWLDFLHLTDVALKQQFYSVERLFVDMDRVQKMLQPSMTALSSGESGQVEAAAKDMPMLVGHLTREFAATREAMRAGAEKIQKILVLKEAIEALTLLSALKFSLPSLPPSAPALLGVGLVAGGDGVMMGTRIVVSAEWVEMMHRLVRAGVLTLPVVGAAVRIQAGQVMMAQSHDELPKGVRDALGDGPEVRGMRVTGRAGAGMNEPPRHHVLPKEFRAWFEKRGFTGEMDIDQFCIKMEQANHEAIHGGGNWKLGRAWPGEWNRMLMEALHDAEIDAGRMLARNEVLDIAAEAMQRYKIPMNFIRWRGR
ncbi:DUF2380 domain-containing protein [Cystobacter ferrugineus]|uniref:DUF2380 domain-containing protein n=2 Tax=Cystobacter ferrugineus TaxID=83449 RepID=A0A1L9B4S2_9BACT|nr:DUF2380 domain-containing protein [Cystobacter ferrugineus]